MGTKLTAIVFVVIWLAILLLLGNGEAQGVNAQTEVYPPGIQACEDLVARYWEDPDIVVYYETAQDRPWFCVVEDHSGPVPAELERILLGREDKIHLLRRIIIEHVGIQRWHLEQSTPPAPTPVWFSI